VEETFTYDNYVQDPTCQQGFNRYAYCFYNPLKYIDPSGERCYGPSEAEKAQMSWNAARQQRQSEIYGDVCQQLQSGMRPNGIADVCGGIAKYFNTVCSEGNSTQNNNSDGEPTPDGQNLLKIKMEIRFITYLIGASLTIENQSFYHYEGFKKVYDSQSTFWIGPGVPSATFDFGHFGSPVRWVFMIDCNSDAANITIQVFSTEIEKKYNYVPYFKP